MLLVLKWRDSNNVLRDLSINLSSMGYFYIGRLDKSVRDRLSIEDFSEVYVFNDEKNFIQNMNVKSRKVSRRHVLIKLISGELIVKDHGRDGSGSTYGTYVDGIQIKRGSSVSIHNKSFKLRIADLEVEVNIVDDYDRYRSFTSINEVLNIIDKIMSVINEVRLQLRCGVPLHMLNPHLVALDDLVRSLEAYLPRFFDRCLIGHILDKIHSSIDSIRCCIVDSNSSDAVILRLLDDALMELKGHLEALDKIVRPGNIVKECSTDGRRI
ncbi:MAG: FHA domain-containing protein [Crenarchaeota archaeon]|nr:FHA domain-containing protein [Thermoproteota archaeon]